jgi:hypothetical protein
MKITKDMRQSKKVVAVIPAKGHSNRLPGKNIYNFMGKPMLAWAIQACFDSEYDIEPWVSSDSQEVLDVAVKYGAKPYLRDSDLAGDRVPKQEVIKDVAWHLINQGRELDAFISLQPNSPQVCGSDLDEGLDELLFSVKGEAMYEIFSVDSNLHMNAVYRMFRPLYLDHIGWSVHAGVVICEREDIHTKEDVDRIEAEINKRVNHWEEAL